MSLTKISPEAWVGNPFEAIGKDWFLLTAGTEESGYNTMTCSWGQMGVLWNKPSVTCYVRHSRHTFGFMEQQDTFTLSFFAQTQRKALSFCGSHSGRDCDKFEGKEVLRSENGLVVLPNYVNAFFSLKVDNYVDLGTHGMFICSVTESKIINNIETMTYNYYQANVKPKPNTEKKKGYVCKVCGYVHEGDLPDDFICPLCKHGVADFEEIK